MVKPLAYVADKMEYLLNYDKEIKELVEKVVTLIPTRDLIKEIKIGEIDVKRKKPVEVIVFIHATRGYPAHVAIKFMYRGDVIFELVKHMENDFFKFYKGYFGSNISGNTWKKVFYKLFEMLAYSYDYEPFRSFIKKGLETALILLTFDTTR